MRHVGFSTVGQFRITLLDYVYTKSDRNRSESNRTGSASVYTGPFWKPSRTEPNGSKIGPTFHVGLVLDPFRTGFKTVQCRQKAYPIRFSDRIHLEPVPC